MSGLLSFALRRCLSTSPSPLQSCVTRALDKVKRPVPVWLQEPQEYFRFNVYLKTDTGSEVSVPVHTASYSNPASARYVQISFDPNASETRAEDRALSLELSSALGKTALACSAVVVGEEESEFSTKDLQELNEQIRERLSGNYPEVTQFLYSNKVEFREETQAVGVVTALTELTGGVSGKSIGFTYFSKTHMETAKALHAAKAKITSLSESQGSSINSNGLDMDSFASHYRAHGTVKGFDGGETLRTLPLHTEKDILLLTHPSGLKERSKVVGESSGYTVPLDWETRSTQTVIPGPVMDLGEVLCALLTHLKGTSPSQSYPAPVLQLLTSQTQAADQLKPLYTSAVQALMQTVLKDILKKREEGYTLKEAMVLKAVS